MVSLKSGAKTEADLIKNEGARVFTTLYINFSDAQGQITPESVVVSGQNTNSFKHILVTCKNEDNCIKNVVARVFTKIFPLQVYGDFSRRSMAANSAVLGPIWPNFKLV